MKTKRTTKQRKQMRDFDVATQDLKSEFGGIYNDMEVLDEEAMVEMMMAEDE